MQERGARKTSSFMRTVLFFVITMGVSTALMAQPERLSLSRAVAIALERNPERKAALAETHATRASAKEAQSAYLPRLTFSEAAVVSNDPVFVFGTRLRQNRFTAADFALNQLNNPGAIGNFATRLGLQWTAFDSFLTRANIRQAANEKAASDQRLARADQLVIFRVVQAYYGALFAVRQVEVAEHAASTAQAVLEQSHARFQTGSTVESDYLLAQVDDAARRQELVKARNALSLSRAQLNLVMGITPERNFELAGPEGPPVLAPPPLAEVEGRALKERPDLKEAEQQVAARKESVQAAKSAFGPRVNVFAGAETDNVNFFGNGGNNWTAGAELQFDIFSGGQKRARLDHEHAGLDRAQALRQAGEDNVRLEVRRAWYDFDSARQAVEINRMAAEQAEEALRIVNNRYQAGMTTITEMLRAEDAARAARTNYWEAVYRMSASYAALELATGILSPQSSVVTP
jgi:outer membrane protein TolC